MIRTYYWHDRVMGGFEAMARRLARRPAGMRFRVGNAGDILVRDLVRHEYGQEARLVRDAGDRLLMVGSVTHVARDGDVLAGVGTKGHDMPTSRDVRLNVVGLRGPITLEAVREAGHDVSRVRFLADPGLLIGGLVGDVTPDMGRIIFIPHYRHRKEVWLSPPKGLNVVDVDARPVDLAREIQRAEFVFSSSLHGLIFAQALGRPCLPVAASSEPWLKYEDHYLAVGVSIPKPVGDIHRWRHQRIDRSPDDVPGPEAVVLPTLEELRSWSVADH